jgi:hypothetical protein
MVKTYIFRNVDKFIPDYTVSRSRTMILYVHRCNNLKYNVKITDAVGFGTNILILKMKAIRFFETSENTQRHIVTSRKR